MNRSVSALACLLFLGGACSVFAAKPFKPAGDADEAIARIRSARRPVIAVGCGDLSDRVDLTLYALAHELKAPVMATAISACQVSFTQGLRLSAGTPVSLSLIHI